MDAYQVLGLAPSSSLAEAEDAYRRLLRVHHPDLHQAAGPDALAAAELRTRALNAAIRQVRADATARTTGAAPPRTATADRRPADGSEPTSGRGPADDLPLVACPLCGEWFATAPSLKAHAAAHHEVRFGRRPRPRALRRRPPLPLWVLVPANAAAALGAARAIDTLVHHAVITVWVLALSMAPSFIRLLSGDDR